MKRPLLLRALADAARFIAFILLAFVLLLATDGCGNGMRGWRNIDLVALQATTDAIALDIASGRLSFAPRHISASHDSLARGDIPPFSDGTFANHVEAIGDYYYWDRSTVWGAEGFVVFPTSATIPSPLILEPFENVTRTKKIADRIWYCVGGNY